MNKETSDIEILDIHDIEISDDDLGALASLAQLLNKQPLHQKTQPETVGCGYTCQGGCGGTCAGSCQGSNY